MNVIADDSFSVSSKIHGETFTLVVNASRSAGTLLIDTLQISVKDGDGACAGTYIFDDRLEAEGAELILALVDSGVVYEDAFVLQRLLEITDRYSCGDWKVITSSESSDRRNARPALVPFEEFVEDPHIPAHRFVSACMDQTVSLSAEFDIAAWGEFVSVRIVEPSGEFIPEMSDFKVLLPESEGRTCRAAYSELKILVERLGQAFSANGYPGLLSTLEALSLEVLCRVSLPADRDDSGPIGRLRIPSTFRCSIAHAQTEIALSIGNSQAEFSVCSSYDSVRSGIDVRFLPGKLLPEFSAAQIRAMRDFYESVRNNGEFPQSRGVSAILSKLSQRDMKDVELSDPTNPVYRLPSGSLPGSLSLSLLVADADMKMPELAHFISSEEAALVAGNRAVQVETRFAITAEVMRELARGGRMIVLRLRRRIALRRPDLAVFLVLTEYPDGSQTVRVVSGMGGSRLFNLRGHVEGSWLSRRVSTARVCRLFVKQEQQGWIPLLRLLQSLGDEDRTASRNMGQPSLDDALAIESFDAAGKALRYLIRGMEPEFWGFCANRDDGSALLSVGSAGLSGALEMRFKGSRVVEIAARARIGGSISPWQDVGTFNHAGVACEGEALFDVVSALRTFFRDQAKSRMGGSAADISQATYHLAQNLKMMSFDCRGLMSRAEMQVGT